MKKMTLSELVCTLQDLAHQGYAMYEVDLDLETHILDGYEVDKENEKRCQAESTFDWDLFLVNLLIKLTLFLFLYILRGFL